MDSHSNEALRSNQKHFYLYILLFLKYLRQLIVQVQVLANNAILDLLLKKQQQPTAQSTALSPSSVVQQPGCSIINQDKYKQVCSTVRDAMSKLTIGDSLNIQTTDTSLNDPIHPILDSEAADVNSTSHCGSNSIPFYSPICIAAHFFFEYNFNNK